MKTTTGKGISKSVKDNVVPAPFGWFSGDSGKAVMEIDFVSPDTNEPRKKKSMFASLEPYSVMMEPEVAQSFSKDLLEVANGTPVINGTGKITVNPTQKDKKDLTYKIVRRPKQKQSVIVYIGEPDDPQHTYPIKMSMADDEAKETSKGISKFVTELMKEPKDPEVRM